MTLRCVPFFLMYVEKSDIGVGEAVKPQQEDTDDHQNDNE